LDERDPGERYQAATELSVSGLEEQQRVFDQAPVPEAEVHPQAEPKVASGEHEKDVGFVEAGVGTGVKVISPIFRQVCLFSAKKIAVFLKTIL
jgi:hypothetical protein